MRNLWTKLKGLPNVSPKYWFLIFAAYFTVAIAAAGAPVKWRVSDSKSAQTLVARGGKLIADYGGFKIIQADDSALTNLDDSRIEREDEFDAIELVAARLDTRAASRTAGRVLRKPAGTFKGI